MREDGQLVRRSSAVFPPAAHHYYPIAISHGAGSWVVSQEGRRYLDFSSGLGVLNLGHNEPRVMEAVRGQLERYVHTGGIYVSETTVAAAEELVSITAPGLDMLFFGSSGAEAVEGALKLARYSSGRQAIISCTGGSHGRTLGALSVTSSSSAYHRRYHPLLPSVYQVSYPTCFSCPYGLTPEACGTRRLEQIAELFERQIPPEEVCAFIMEPFLGAGGLYPAPSDYLRGVRSLCDTHGILLIFDEIQSGIGRTGRWFYAEQAGVVPDLLTVGNGLASGFPLSALIAGAGIMQDWEAGAHGSTFGGNPVGCAAARATLQVIREDGLLTRSRVAGLRTLGFLQGLASRNPHIGEVRGQGCMVGVEFVDQGGAPDGPFCARLLERCLARGLILIDCGVNRNVARFLPPLNVSAEEMDEALSILAAVLAELS